MTTIAYRNGELAGESRVTDTDTDTILPEVCKKVHRLRDGSLFGAAGDNEGGETLFDCLRKSLPLPKLKGTTALLIMPDRTIWFYEKARWVRTKSAYAAIGAGSPYALAVMAYDAQATARDAVKIACKLHPNSGGRIHVVRLT